MNTIQTSSLTKNEESVFSYMLNGTFHVIEKTLRVVFYIFSEIFKGVAAVFCFIGRIILICLSVISKPFKIFKNNFFSQKQTSLEAPSKEPGCVTIKEILTKHPNRFFITKRISNNTAWEGGYSQEQFIQNLSPEICNLKVYSVCFVGTTGDPTRLNGFFDRREVIEFYNQMMQKPDSNGSLVTFILLTASEVGFNTTIMRLFKEKLCEMPNSLVYSAHRLSNFSNIKLTDDKPV